MFEAISTPSLFLFGAATESLFSGPVLLLLLIVAVVAGIFLARFITNSLRVSDYSGRAAVVAVSLLVAGLMIVSKWPPKFGVDLSGGINMIGSLNLSEIDGRNGKPPKAEDIIPVLMNRVNPSGTEEIMIRPLGSDKIEVTMPTVDLEQAKDTWNNLVKVGLLEFRILANPEKHSELIQTARELARQGERSAKIMSSADPEVVVGKWVSIARVFNEELGIIEKDAPFKFVPGGLGLVRNASTGELINVNRLPLSGKLDQQKFQLAKWAKEQGVRDIQVLVVEPEERMDVQGKDLTKVSWKMDDTGGNAVSFNLTSEGSKRMGRLTGRNMKQPMGIVLDGKLHSAPTINGRISGSGEITGDFSRLEIDDLIGQLKSGKLDVAMNKQPISTDFIESTLGNELKQKGFWAIGLSMVLVLVFMVVYYRFAGFVAAFALLMNLVLILALVMAIGVKFTLTGLAGLVLTVGMSVDANVLIFERIREELARGAALRMAIRNGFDKARTTIVDANVTTLITALVLYAIGTEQIKGFAVTLVLGILMSMFTAIYVSRLVFDIWERKRWLKELNMNRILDKGKYNFLSMTKLTGLVSIGLIIAGLIGTFTLGAKILDQDLRGGSTARMVFKEKQDLKDVRSKLDALKVVYKPTGEEVEFNVSSYGTQGDLAGQKFKVDSNLPAWEGENSKDSRGNEIEKFKELDEILAETFAGKLMMHSVSVKGTANRPPAEADSNDQSSVTPLRSRPKSGEAFWNAVLPTPAALTGGMLVYQDEVDAPEEFIGAAEGETIQEEAPGSSDPAEAEQTPDVDPPATDSPVTQSPLGNLNLGSLDPTETAEVAEDVERNKLIKVKRTLVVEPASTGKTVASFIFEAAKRIEANLDEEQIVMDSKDKLADEAAETTKSKDWTVQLEVRDEAEADRILDEWQSRFNETPYFETSSSVGGQIAGETGNQAILAIVASLIGIVAYVWIRFQNLAFGLAAVVALVHDVLIVLGAIAISHWVSGGLWFVGIEKFKISLEIIAALLTVIGYSLNDTIVVFDRIREVRGKRTEITADMIDTSISQTLSRTILTSVTTFIVVFILYWFGGEAIHGFAFALVIGVIVGTYSSIFVASPALLWLMNSVGLNPGEVEPEVAEAK